MAKKNRPSPPGSPLETRMERFKAAAAEIWEKQDSAPLGNPLASGFDVLESYLMNFIQQFEDDDARLDKLEDLLKKAEDLLKRLENIDLEGLDPEKIKQKVLDALTGWKADMEAALLALQNSDRDQNTRLDGLKNQTDSLAASDLTQNTQLASIEEAFQGLRDKDQAFATLLADLAKKLGDLTDSDKKQTARIEEIANTLAELLAKLGGIDFNKLDPEKIKQAVLETLAAWRSEVGNAILQLKAEAALLATRVAALEEGLAALRKKFDDIDFDNLNPEKIRQQVLDALVEWKKQLENTLAALAARTAALEAWKQITDQSLAAHGNRLSLAETTLTGHTAAINRLRNDLEALEAEVSRIIAKGGADPEDIKNRVLAALQAWQALLDASISELTRRVTESERLLGDHSNALARHGSDIEALRKKIEEILASPHTPDVIVTLVIEALAEWRKQLEKRLAELQAAQATDHADIGRHTQQLADIRNQIEKIFQDIAGLGQVEGRLTDALKDLRVDLETKLALTDDRVDELENLLRTEVARLDARIKSIETTGIDPEDVREIIRTEFKAWQDAIENRIKTVETVTKGLRFGYDALIRRLVKLEVNSLDADKVRQILRDDLALWRAQTDQAIADIWKKIKDDAALLAQWQIEIDLRLDGDESDIAGLKKALTDLATLVNEKFAAIPDIETIKITVLDLFAEWRKKVDDRLTGGENTSRQLRDDLTELDRQVKELARSIPDAETLKNAILQLLDDWQKRIERKISALDTRTDKAEERLGVLGAALKKLEDRVNELVLTGGTHIEVEKRLHEAIESWQKQLEKELNAIRDRNEQDRLALLQLRGTLDILQERVRKLENRDLLAEVLKILEDRLKAVETQAKAADEKADHLIKRLDELTKTDGAIEQLTKALETLRIQVAERPDRAEVQRMIDAALDGLAEWRRQTDTSIKILNIGLKKTNDDLNELREQANRADRLINKDLEQKTGALGDRITDLDRRTDERLDAAEKRLDEDDIQDKLLEERLDHRLDLLEGWQTATNTRLNKAEGVDKEHDRRIAALQKQIDDWKPDVSGDFADRLARRCLTGRGIVLGFDVWHTNKFTLNIGPGLGITSDGHMIRSREPDHYTHYRRLKTADQYPFFVKKSGKPVEVWELVPESADETGCTPLTPQRSADKLAPFIHDKVALALLPPSGTPPGEEIKITFALVHREDIALLMQADRLLRLFVAEHEDTDLVFEETYSPLDEIPFEDDFYRALRPELSLEEIPLLRFGFQPRDKCTTAELDSTDFPDLHTSPPPPAMLRFFDTYKLIIEDAFNRLDWQLRKVIRQYSRLFFPQYPAAYFEDGLDKLMMKWTDYIQFCSDHLKTPKLENPQIYVQYFYDWARDLVAAYHELRNELQFLMAASCIAEENDPKAKHPHHLMLGLAMREEHNGLASPLRHEFVQPPIYNGNAARLETCKLYFRRWFLLVKGFYLPIDKDPVANPTCHRDDDGEFPKPLDYKRLRITPGRGYFHVLSEQSLPFYYLVTLGTQSVHRFWNYRRAKTGTVNQLLCYHANDSGDSYSGLPHVIRPLYYSLDAYDFYRIEGHMGLTSAGPVKVVDLITNMVQKFNLDFDVEEMELKTLTKHYAEKLLDPSTLAGKASGAKFSSFVEKILGAEHLAGVPKGGTFIVVTENGKVVGDFSIPYRCCKPLKVEAEVGDCRDGMVIITLDITPPNPTGSGFRVFLDGKEVSALIDGKEVPGPFQYSQPLIALRVPSDGLEHHIEVQDIIGSAKANVTVPADCTCSLKIETGSIKCLPHDMAEVSLKVTPTNPSSDHFTLFLDGASTPLGTFPYSQPTVVVPLRSREAPYTIRAEDAKNPACAANTSVITPNLTVTATTDGKCVNNKVKINVAVQATHAPSDHFKIFFGEDEVAGGPFLYAKTAQIEVFGIGRRHTIKVQDATDANCDAETKITIPNCTCSMTVQAIVDNKCVDGKVKVSVAATPTNPVSKNFILFLDGTLVSGNPFPYSKPAQLEVPGAGIKGYTIKVQDEKNKTCSIETQIFTPNCACSMIMRATVDEKCVEGKVRVLVNVKPTNPRSNDFRMFLDGKEVPGGAFPYSKTAEIAIPGDGKVHQIKVQDVEDDTCSTETEVTTPNCACSLIVTAEAGKLEPNCQVKVQVTVIATNPASPEFRLFLEGKEVPGPFRYSSRSVEIIALADPDRETVQTIMVQDSKIEACNAQTQVNILRCAV